MKITGNTILITGGASGIGYAMAEEFLKNDNTVIICGRREDRLKQAKEEHPALVTHVCDVTKNEEREALFQWATDNFKDLNVLVNNAGIQRDIDFTKGVSDIESGESEIAVNLEAPINLCARFTPFLTGQKDAVILNVSSGLAFMAERASRMPIYCATKAGLHAFCLALRVQLKQSGIEVIEAIPPSVISELNPEGRRKRGAGFSGFPAGEYIDLLFEKLAQGENEIKIMYTGERK